jgi:DTW domain-containing protein YfiP
VSYIVLIDHRCYGIALQNGGGHLLSYRGPQTPTTTHKISDATAAVVESLHPSPSLPQHLQFKIASSVVKCELRNQGRKYMGRELCGRCERPPAVCLCTSLPEQKISLAVHVLVLQHPNEFRKKNVSTVPLLSLVLKHFSKKIGYEFDANDILSEHQSLLGNNNQKPLLLFPGPDAVRLDDPADARKTEIMYAAKPSSDNEIFDVTPSQLLILFDGTWTEAKRMVNSSPSLLAACQQVQFTGNTKSIYDAIRREPQEHFISTLESCALVLQLLEPASDKTRLACDHLHGALATLVSHQKEFRRVNSEARYVDFYTKEKRAEQIKDYKRLLFEHETTTVETTSVHNDTTILRRI